MRPEITRPGRRQFIAALGAAGAAAVAKPALAQTAPEIVWKMTSSFSPALDLLFGGAETFAKTVAELTEGKFTITVYPAGEIAGAGDAMEAVAQGKAECAHTALMYSWNKEPALAFGTCVPFGMNARQHAAWLQESGGVLLDEVLIEKNLFALPLGNTGGQMAGWFRKEIRGPLDFQGLKMRIGGFAGKILQTLGAEAVAIPRDAVSAALESGSLDAFEWVGPYDDERFGMGKEGAKPIAKLAPYYYYPGWWKGGVQMHLAVAKDKFESLPKPYQAAIRVAAAQANSMIQARYDIANPGALKRVVVAGAELRLFPQDALEACYRVANDLYQQLSAENPKFKKIAESYLAFRGDQYLWWQVAEYSFDNFMIRQRRGKG